MATTYLQAVNEVLRESNEVVLTSGGFSNAVGIQAYIKDAINRAYLEICAKEEEWAFLAAAESNANDPYAGNTSVETTAGTRWYLLKSGSTGVTEDFAKVDWNSFFLTSEGATAATPPYEYSDLEYKTFEHWRLFNRKSEAQDSNDTQEYGLPSRVIQSKDGRYFGLSPIPKQAYKVYFTAWVQPTKLSAHDDEFLVPDMYMPVVLHRARYYMNMFKKDFQEASLADQSYRLGLREMRRGLIGNEADYAMDDRLVF